MAKNAGTLLSGRVVACGSAIEVPAGLDKFDTTNTISNKPTSPGEVTNSIAVDNQVLSDPAGPG